MDTGRIVDGNDRQGYFKGEINDSKLLRRPNVMAQIRYGEVVTLQVIMLSTVSQHSQRKCDNLLLF